MSILYHIGDLPNHLDLGSMVAVDTETMGLSLVRDRLCVVQLSGGDGTAHVVHFPRPVYECPNLIALLSNHHVTKLFHYARFDLAILRRSLGVRVGPVWCTKIASKLCRTNTERHGLKDLCRDLIGVEMSKQQQTSDWGAETLSQEQIAYAASDVLYLHRLQDKLSHLLRREGRMELAEACFRFLPTRAELDLSGWDEEDLFSH